LYLSIAVFFIQYTPQPRQSQGWQRQPGAGRYSPAPELLVALVA